MRPAFYVLLGVLLVPTVGLVGDIVTDGKFRSTKLTGAPLQVASDDMVANLNSDMVDGIEGTDIYTKAEVDALVAVAAAADSRRWFYLTTGNHNGAAADTACDSGFHMASIYEILDVSNLRYGTGRGYVTGDSGSGPPHFAFGWVRTGNQPYVSGGPGYANCSAWSSASSPDLGTSAYLNYVLNDPATVASPWVATVQNCDVGIKVWCLED